MPSITHILYDPVKLMYMGSTVVLNTFSINRFGLYIRMDCKGGTYRVETDFYGLLNSDISSSSEQISTEFRLLARKHHPDKVTDWKQKEAAEKYFVLLKKARDVLLDANMRHKYDQWRTGFSKWICFDDWMKMQNRVHTSVHWAETTKTMAPLEQMSKNANVGQEKSENICSMKEVENDGSSEHCCSSVQKEQSNEGAKKGGQVTALQEFRSEGGRLKESKFTIYKL